MIWSTNGCEDDVYDEIVTGDWPGCRTTNDKLTCDLEPRPGCCFKPMHDFARFYSIVCFVLLGIFVPCLCCLGCFLIAASKASKAEEAQGAAFDEVSMSQRT